jgi:uroporphyrinogen-III synthase
MLTVAEKEVLYLGTDPTNFVTDRFIRHLPMIKVVPRPLHALDIQHAFAGIFEYTHLVFTSKSSAVIFFRHLKKLGVSIEEIEHIEMIAMGRVTAAYLREEGFEPIDVPHEESVEGLMDVMSRLDLSDAYMMLTRSNTVYPKLTNYLKKHSVPFEVCDLYSVVECIPKQLPSLRDIDEVVFSSPLTVENFFRFFQPLPCGLKLTALGINTTEKLRGKLENLIGGCQLHSESGIHVTLSRN